MHLLFKCSILSNEFVSLCQAWPPNAEIEHHLWHFSICFLDLEGVCEGCGGCGAALFEGAQPCPANWHCKFQKKVKELGASEQFGS